MHWPVGNTGPDGNLTFDYVPVSMILSIRWKYITEPTFLTAIQTWHALEKLVPTNKTKYIGICNFGPKEFYKLLKNSTIKPAVHQMELHPYLQQTWWITQHKVHGIAVTAYSPLGDTNPTYHKGDDDDDKAPRLLDNPVLKKIAERRNCSVAQVALSWGIHRGTAVIPKSSNIKHIKENFVSPGCKLSLLDLAEIKGIGFKYLKRFNNPSTAWGVKLFKGLEGVKKSTSQAN